MKERIRERDNTNEQEKIRIEEKILRFYLKQILSIIRNEENQQAIKLTHESLLQIHIAERAILLTLAEKINRKNLGIKTENPKHTESLMLLGIAENIYQELLERRSQSSEIILTKLVKRIEAIANIQYLIIGTQINLDIIPKEEAKQLLPLAAKIAFECIIKFYETYIYRKPLDRALNKPDKTAFLTKAEELYMGFIRDDVLNKYTETFLPIRNDSLTTELYKLIIKRYEEKFEPEDEEETPDASKPKLVHGINDQQTPKKIIAATRKKIVKKQNPDNSQNPDAPLGSSEMTWGFNFPEEND